MKKLTIIELNSSIDVPIETKEIEIIKTTSKDIRNAILSSTGKYICFICNDDRVSDNYFDLIYEKTNEKFDCCYINNEVNIGIKRENKRNNSEEYLSTIKPYYLEYIWQFVFRTSILKKILDFEYNYEFDEKIDKIIKKSTAIQEIIYFHNGNNTEWTIEGVPYVDYKNKEYYKNIIYLRDSCGIFSGIITWIMNIGRCFGKEYDITLLYDDIFPETEKYFKKYIKTVRREKDTNYVCERFIDTYLDYDFPRNIFYEEESSTFIHGIMGDEDLAPDIYDRYIAVSDTCRKTVTLGFETNKKPEYIHNPIKIEDNMVKPHLRLVSTQRSENIKGLDRLEKFAQILDEENIPYTWNVFTDVNEGTNKGGFIYRNGVFNPLSYVQDSDYLVILSDIESFCYSVAEALSLNTKVVVTPLEVFSELGVKNKKNGYIIPFEYFEDNNKEKLRKKVIEIYKNKDKIIKDELAPLNFYKFSELLKK